MQFLENQGAAHPMPPPFVTFRLADSLPREPLDDWPRASSSLKLRRTSRDAFHAANPPPWDDITEACYHGPFSDKLDEHLDAEQGSCALRDPRLAQIVADRLHHFDGQHDDFWSDVILPNHVHALFTLATANPSPTRSKAGKAFRAVSSPPTSLSALNPFWQPDDFDRRIRSPEHFSTVKAYIRENPAKAGLKAGFCALGATQIERSAG